MQPTFNPWIGYFDLIDFVDKFIFLDTVQLNQQSWQTRNKIKAQDKELMISIPIQKNKTKNSLFIKDTLIDFRKFDFRKKLLKTLKQNYIKSKYYDEVNEFITELILFETDYLSKYNINMIAEIAIKFNINTKTIVLSSEDYNADLVKGDSVLNICKYFHATEYISPLGSKEYLDKVKSKFETNCIDIFYQYYNHPVYEQLGEEFIPYLGIFDLLYNNGFEKSKLILVNGRKYKKVENENR